MRKILTLAILLAGCATAPKKPPSTDPEAQKALGQRIDHICSLPPEERAVELEKLKKETGMALLCGNKSAPQ
jgi:hypothetical protein